MRYWILPLALAMIHAGVSEAQVERQTRGTGECSIEADLVDLDGGWVTLRTTEGKLIDLPAAKLSRADQRWVRAHSPPRTKPAHGRASYAEARCTQFGTDQGVQLMPLPPLTPIGDLPLAVTAGLQVQEPYDVSSLPGDLRSAARQTSNATEWPAVSRANARC